MSSAPNENLPPVQAQCPDEAPSPIPGHEDTNQTEKMPLFGNAKQVKECEENKREQEFPVTKTLRKGKWSPEEEEYAARLIQYFQSGHLKLPNGVTTLRTYLAQKLFCDPMRISKKYAGPEYRLGRKIDQSCCSLAGGQKEPPSNEIQKAHSELKALELRFRLIVEKEQEVKANRRPVPFPVLPAKAQMRINNNNNTSATESVSGVEKIKVTATPSQDWKNKKVPAAKSRARCRKKDGNKNTDASKNCGAPTYPSAGQKRNHVEMMAEQPLVVPLSCLKTNKNGGLPPANGRAYSLEQKKQVAVVYARLAQELGGTDRVKATHLAREGRVSRRVAQKILDEIRLHGGVLDPVGIKKRGQHMRGRGFGGRILTSADKTLLMQLRSNKPKLTLTEYKQHLLDQTGTVVSETTIFRWFQQNEKYTPGHDREEMQQEEQDPNDGNEPA